jgi:ATP-dependent Clp protease ATP-binding subunit ClpX
MADSKQRCSFCRRPPNEVKSLIAGPDEGVFICDKCVGKAAETVQGHATRVSKEERPLQPPREIKKYLDEYVIGQESTKKALSVAVYNHYKRREAIRAKIDLGGIELKKSNVILPGPSGTGKTECFRAIARMLGVPFHIADASRLTQAGYVGDDVETLIQGLMESADHDVERAEWGIVFLDEFDKIARKSGRDGMGFRDIGGEGVQQALLKLVEGSKVAVPRGMGQKMMAMMQATDIIDTENVLFICAGSFDGIQEEVKKRLNKGASLGFGAAARKVDLSLTEVYSNVT